MFVGSREVAVRQAARSGALEALGGRRGSLERPGGCVCEDPEALSRVMWECWL